jgi:acyl-coenzyme A synthetase/AMP-(fatty) acid ligase
VQIEPKVLFVDNGVRYNGKAHESMTKVKEIIRALPTLEAVVVFETIEGLDDNISSEHLSGKCKAIKYKDLAVQETFTS